MGPIGKVNEDRSFTVDVGTELWHVRQVLTVIAEILLSAHGGKILTEKFHKLHRKLGYLSGEHTPNPIPDPLDKVAQIFSNPTSFAPDSEQPIPGKVPPAAPTKLGGF